MDIWSPEYNAFKLNKESIKAPTKIKHDPLKVTERKKKHENAFSYDFDNNQEMNLY